MALNFLVPECLIRHSYSEMGKRISISQKEDERIAFFQLDIPAFRQKFNLQVDKVCDLLIFYRKGYTQSVLMLVELKGSDLTIATDQICSTFNALRNQLQSPLKKDARWIALVVSSSGCPPNKNSLQKKLASLDVSLLFKTGVKSGGVVDARGYLD